MLEELHSLHLAAITTDGRLWHAVRRPNGVWSRFRDVEREAGERGTLVDVDLQVMGPASDTQVHLAAVNSDGRLWHSVRSATGEWTVLRDVEAETGERGRFATVALAQIHGELHLVAVRTDGRLWHTLRSRNGSWAHFGDVEGQAGNRGTFVAVGIAQAGGVLHICGVTSSGHLWHALRQPTGEWTPFRDIEQQAGNRGAFVDVDCVGLGASLHLCAVNSDGHLWHSLRERDGTWTPLRNVEHQARERGSFTRVSLGAGAQEELHVAGVTVDGHLWHALRHASGSWEPLRDVEARTGERGLWRPVGVDGF